MACQATTPGGRPTDRGWAVGERPAYYLAMRFLRPALILGLLWLVPSTARAAEAPVHDPAVALLIEDYIGLYKRDTLARWRELFLAGFTATSTNDDGSVTTRSLDEFYERQRVSFASGKPVSETLENTQIQRTGQLASVRSDFVWTDGDVTRRGRLMLLLIVEHDRLRIQALTFSYSG